VDLLTFLRSAKGHADSVSLLQVADAALLVAPHQRQQYHSALLPLEVVHRRHAGPRRFRRSLTGASSCQHRVFKRKVFWRLWQPWIRLHLATEPKDVTCARCRHNDQLAVGAGQIEHLLKETAGRLLRTVVHREKNNSMCVLTT